jgi:hypothetical protein
MPAGYVVVLDEAVRDQAKDGERRRDDVSRQFRAERGP